MRWLILILIMVMSIMMVMLYSLLVIASRADDEAERWCEERKGADDE